MQVGTIQPGQNVVVIDDLAVTGEQHAHSSNEAPFLILFSGGSAAAAGELIAKQGGNTIEYLFIIEATFLNPNSKLDAPIYSIIQVDDDSKVDSARDVGVFETLDICRSKKSCVCPGRSAVDDPETSQMIESGKGAGPGKVQGDGEEKL